MNMYQQRRAAYAKAMKLRADQQEYFYHLMSSWGIAPKHVGTLTWMPDNVEAKALRKTLANRP